MSWAARRRFLILLILGAVAAAFLATVLIATLTKAPTCADGIQNQGEAGIDCGGPCTYLCRADMQAPTVLYTKALGSGTGRTDIIALIENKNASAAARGVPYRIALYGAGQALLQEVEGTLDLPPGRTVPVYVPRIETGKQAVAGAFLDLDASAVQWFAATVDAGSQPQVSNIALSGSTAAPRVQATLANPNATALRDVRAVVIVHDEQGGVIAASQTVVPSIPAQGQATATFTWNAVWSAVPATIEVLPVISLPLRQVAP